MHRERIEIKIVQINKSMSKVITKTKNIHSFQDVTTDENEDCEYIRMMITEIDELNLKLNEERKKNDKNDVYI